MEPRYSSIPSPRDGPLKAADMPMTMSFALPQREAGQPMTRNKPSDIAGRNRGNAAGFMIEFPFRSTPSPCLENALPQPGKGDRTPQFKSRYPFSRPVGLVDHEPQPA